MQNILCKIATAATTIAGFDPNAPLNYPEFVYNDKPWRSLNFIQNAQQLEEILNIVEEHGRAGRISLAAHCITGDAEDLVIVLKGDKIIKAVEDALFPLIYKNFTIPTRAQPGRCVLDYVTTALYDALYNKHAAFEPATTTVNSEVTLPAYFRPTLCNFQVRTVQWLLQREKQSVSFPAYFTRLEAKDNCSFVYKHKYCSNLLWETPPPITLSPGGILADEMGLGKTVEMLALIITHTRPAPTALPFDLDEPPLKRLCGRKTIFCICNMGAKVKGNLVQCTSCGFWQHAKCVMKYEESNTSEEEQYLCPSCWHEYTKTALLQASTTFIVAPRNIKMQWLEEIKRHTGGTMRVFDYNEAVAAAWISPQQLARYDIVLTDYLVLTSEVYHTSEYVSERQLRQRQRSMRRMTPLLMLQWWRVCEDEAQMIETPASKVAAMVRMVPTINRWAVTGTPLQRAMHDLRALLQFIGFDAAVEPMAVWQHLERDFVEHYADEPEERPLIEVLQKCMWRTCKSRVLAELNIPPQTQLVHRLRLSNLEKLFYMEQHWQCKSSFDEKVNKYLDCTDKVVKISPRIMKLILQPLLKIRQCCIMPVVSPGNQNKHSATVSQKLFLHPKDLHTHMKTANALECKAELRTMASSYNGLASIYFLRQNYADAVHHYEMVLRLARDYEEWKISVDSLLQIHALHNLLQACHTSPQCAENLSSSKLEEYEQQYHALEWKYLEPYTIKLNSERTSYLNAKQSHRELIASANLNLLNFISDLIERICDEREDFQTALMHKIFDDFISLFADNQKLQSLQSLHGVLYVLSDWYKKVEIALNSLHKQFEEIKYYTDNVRSRDQVKPVVWRMMVQFVRSVFDCHLSEILEDDRKTQKVNKRKFQKPKKELCSLCKIRDTLNNFECLLFNKVIHEETQIIEGIERPAMEVWLIKILFGFLRTKTNFHAMAADMDKHWAALECSQTLCKKMLKYWIEIEYTVKAYDELDMCKMRISLTDQEEDKSHYQIMEHEVEQTFMVQEANLFEAQREFAKKLARLKYIIHLEADASSGPCPICQSDDETRYAVLECGHHICVLCLRTIRSRYVQQKLCCPICRNRQSSHKIYYVTRNASTIEPEQDVHVTGDYSTKIHYIVRQILKLKQQHANDAEPLKILIFSEWREIQKAIADALKENGIRYRDKGTHSCIEEFKNPHLGVTCLLMLLSKFCSGLNIIEATHVFLVEPMLNPGEEAQAIGRVHRFGQTKPTTVHRFIVCNTIEENIFNLVTANMQSQFHWNFQNMTVDNLRNLFHLENDISEDYDTGAEVETIEENENTI